MYRYDFGRLSNLEMLISPAHQYWQPKYTKYSQKKEYGSAIE